MIGQEALPGSRLFLSGCIVSFWSAGHDVREFNREKHVQHTFKWLFAFVDLFFGFCN